MWERLFDHNGVVRRLAFLGLAGILAAAALFGLLSGYLLAIGVVGLVVVVPIVLAELEFHDWLRRRSTEAAPTAEEVPAVSARVLLRETPAVPVVVPRPVVVRVAQAEGVCPLGRRFTPGQTFVFTDGVVGQGLCPRAEALLRPAIERYRHGEVTGGALTVMCRSPKHLVVLSIVEEAQMQPAAVEAG